MKLFKTRSTLAGINRGAQRTTGEKGRQRGTREEKKSRRLFAGTRRGEEEAKRKGESETRRRRGESPKGRNSPKPVASPSINSTCWRELQR